MPDNRFEADLWRSALGPGPDCPDAVDLAHLFDENMGASPLAKHVTGCPYCQAELRLLQEFEACEPRPDEAAAVERITKRLQGRSAAILPGQAARPAPWWKTVFSIPRLAPVALAMAAIVVILGVTLQMRRTGAPSLRPLSESGPDVLRSNAVALIAPTGDLQQPPAEIRWQPIPSAARYEVRLLEVDRTELWKAATTESFIELPPAVRKRIVPAKTLLVQVTALDAAGSTLGQSDLLRFRLALNPQSK